MTFDVGNTTGLWSLFEASNTMTGGVFGITLLLMIWSVAFFTTKGYQTPVSFTFASTISAVMAIIFYTLNLIGGAALALAILLGSLSVVYMFTLNRTST